MRQTQKPRIVNLLMLTVAGSGGEYDGCQYAGLVYHCFFL